jgi:hypothetical protein
MNNSLFLNGLLYIAYVIFDCWTHRPGTNLRAVLMSDKNEEGDLDHPLEPYGFQLFFLWWWSGMVNFSYISIICRLRMALDIDYFFIHKKIFNFSLETKFKLFFDNKTNQHRGQKHRLFWNPQYVKY